MQGQVIGGYQILRRIGEGGMGVVYQAVHTQIKRQAAIKLLHPQYSQNPQLAQRFLNEAKAVNIVKHPGLVEVFEYGQLPDKTAYIVMEYLAGETLKQLLERRGGSLSVAESLNWTRQIAGTLAAAHACGVVHRDLKPDNIMLVDDPQAEGGLRTKVLDFGIAKLSAEHAEAACEHTETGLMMGTPAYMSPEQCLGAGRVDDRADVYSLGAMLYQMLGGQVPFVAEGKGALILMHMTQKPPPLRQLAPQVPEPLAALCQRMLAKKREDRPSMTEAAAFIAEFETGRVAARSWRRTSAIWASWGLVVFTGSTAAVHYWPRVQPARPPQTPVVSISSPAGPAPVHSTGPLQLPILAAASPAAPSKPEDAPTAQTPARERPAHRRDGHLPAGKKSHPIGRTGLIERTPRFD